MLYAGGQGSATPPGAMPIVHLTPNVLYSSGSSDANTVDTAATAGAGQTASVDSAGYEIAAGMLRGLPSQVDPASSQIQAASGERSGPLPSHDNYSGYDVSEPNSTIVYAVPVADDAVAAQQEAAAGNRVSTRADAHLLPPSSTRERSGTFC